MVIASIKKFCCPDNASTQERRAINTENQPLIRQRRPIQQRQQNYQATRSAPIKIPINNQKEKEPYIIEISPPRNPEDEEKLKKNHDMLQRIN